MLPQQSHRSVTIPPPRLMSSEWRVAPFSVSCLHTERFSIFCWYRWDNDLFGRRINSEEAIGKQYVGVLIGENKTFVVMNVLYNFFQVIQYGCFL